MFDVLLGVLAQLLLGYVFAVLRPQLPAALLISFGLCALPDRLIGVGAADDDLALSGDPMAGDCHVIAQLDLLAQLKGPALVRIGLGGNLAAEFLPVPAEAGVFRHRSPCQGTVGIADVILVAESLRIPVLGVPDLRFLRLGFLLRLAFADRFFGNAPLPVIEVVELPLPASETFVFRTKLVGLLVEAIGLPSGKPIIAFPAGSFRLPLHVLDRREAGLLLGHGRFGHGSLPAWRAWCRS